MQHSAIHYFPVEWPSLPALFLLFSLLVVLVEFRIDFALCVRTDGNFARYAMWILLFTLLGSSINIPLAEFPPEKVISGTVVHHNGMRYVVPVVHHWPATVLAINVGGALIPIMLAFYLVVRNRLDEVCACRGSGGARHVPSGAAGARSRNHSSDLHASDCRRRLRTYVVLAASRTACLRRRKHGYTHRRRPYEFGQDSGAGRASCIDWQSGNV
jgi:hypothetical protein